MLPEKLAVALALLGAILMMYIGQIHHWGWPERLISIMLAVLVMMIVGRVVGTISAKELARSFAASEDAGQSVPESKSGGGKAKSND